MAAIKSGSPRHSFPVTANWLDSVAFERPQLEGRSIAQYELYFGACGDGSLALSPKLGIKVEVDRVLAKVADSISRESELHLVCIHLDNGDEFYIRPQECYDGDGLDSNWHRWVDLSREVHTPQGGE